VTLAAGLALLGMGVPGGRGLRWAALTGVTLALQWLYLGAVLTRLQRAKQLPSGFGPATWITLLRGSLLAGAAGFAGMGGTGGWAPAGLFTTAIALDLLDGYVARCSGRVSRLGEDLELGMDSLAMLVGSGLAVLHGTLPWPYLSFGLASPVFRLGLWSRSRLGLPSQELPPSSVRRRIAGFCMGFLSVALWPIVSPTAAAWAGLLFLVPFLGGFGRDWVSVAGPPRAPHALWLVGPALVWLVLRDIPGQALLAALRELAWGEVLALAAVNLAVVASFSGRWWSVLSSLGRRVRYLRLVGYRLAAFAVSYFTPGPHLGGEPLQVFLLNRREAIPTGPAAASVALEKAIEVVLNSGVLAASALAIARLRLVPEGAAGWLAVAALGLLLIPLAGLTGLWAGGRPISRILDRVPPSWLRGQRVLAWATAAREAEREMIEFGRRGPGGALRAMILSLVSWGLLLWEYWLALRFLGLQLSPLETLAVVGAARLAILLPFPGALGALEASQVMALAGLGYTPAQGAAMALLIRARDVAFGAVGLLLGLGLVRGSIEADGGGRS
jgi:uncharacterized protein (TIRG00374 family)